MAQVAGPATLTYQPHVLASVLRSICVTTRCLLGEAWAPVPGPKLSFELISAYAHGPGPVRVHVKTQGGTAFTQTLDSTFIRANKSAHSLALRLCEDTVERGTVVYSYSELDTDALLRALEFRFHTALAVPVTLDGAVVAILVLFASQPLNVTEHVIGFVHSTACSVGSLMEWHKSLVSAPPGKGLGDVPPAAEFTNALPRFPAARPPAVTPTMLCADSVLLSMGMALGACRCESWFPFMEPSGTPCFRITALTLPVAAAAAITSADGDPASQHLCSSIQARPSQMWWDAQALASLGSTARSATSFPILQKGADDTDTLAAVVIVFWATPFAQHRSVTNFLLHAAHAVGLATPLVAALPPPPTTRSLPQAAGMHWAGGPGAAAGSGHGASMTGRGGGTFAGAGHGAGQAAPSRTTHARKRGRSGDDGEPAAGLSAASAKRREEYDKLGGTRKLNTNELDLVRRDVRETRTVMAIEARRGKWTPEEEAYCAELVAGFQAGILPIGEGTTLRSMLSQQLHCVPMRITKKYNKDSSMGKQMYRRSVTLAPLVWCAARDSCLGKLAHLRHRFVGKVREKSELDLDAIVADAIGSDSFFAKGLTAAHMAMLMRSAGMPVPTSGPEAGNLAAAAAASAGAAAALPSSAVATGPASGPAADGEGDATLGR